MRCPALCAALVALLTPAQAQHANGQTAEPRKEVVVSSGCRTLDDAVALAKVIESGPESAVYAMVVPYASTCGTFQPRRGLYTWAPLTVWLIEPLFRITTFAGKELFTWKPYEPPPIDDPA